MYKRILIKLSGEQLQGNQNGGFDSQRASWIANQIKEVVANGTEVIVMVGGGNYARGSQLVNEKIRRITADYVGMLATMINALTLADVFNSEKLQARALSNITADQILDQFTHRRAISHLEKGRVVIVAGGTGRPFLTTDTAAVDLALELSCDLVIKATKVDGVYSADPTIDESAEKFDRLSYEQAVANDKIAVMDKAALGLAMEQKIPIIICDLLTDRNIARVAMGENVGTIIN